MRVRKDLGAALLAAFRKKIDSSVMVPWFIVVPFIKEVAEKMLTHLVDLEGRTDKRGAYG